MLLTGPYLPSLKTRRSWSAASRSRPSGWRSFSSNCAVRVQEFFLIQAASLRNALETMGAPAVFIVQSASCFTGPGTVTQGRARPSMERWQSG
jgi:hypothetical protein